jgi:NADH-quinone oxidoreductase subunit J
VSAGGQIVFLLCAAVAIVAAVLTVSARSPLRAAMALLTNILALAGLYVTLHAHLLAAIQLLVYAGAVVVLFVFVIMLIGPSAEPKGEGASKGMLVRMTAAILMALVGVSLAFGVATAERPYVDIDQCASGQAECGQFGGVDALGNAIYRDGAVPFEIVSILLLVAIIAAVAIARGHSPEQKEELEKKRGAAADGRRSLE